MPADAITWRRWKTALLGGTAVVVAGLLGGTGAFLHVGERTARDTAKTALERVAQSVENTLNRQLLQVDGSLASIPNIVSALHPAGARPVPEEVGQLLRDLNFQTFAFRDIMLLRPDGTVWASARSRSPAIADAVSSIPRTGAVGAASVLGPIRNRITGDTALYLARPVSLPGLPDLTAAAEIPIPVLVRLLSENPLWPGTRVQIARADGRLLAVIPADERQIGQVMNPPPRAARSFGRAFETTGGDGRAGMSIVRPSLYADVSSCLRRIPTSPSPIGIATEPGCPPRRSPLPRSSSRSLAPSFWRRTSARRP